MSHWKAWGNFRQHFQLHYHKLLVCLQRNACLLWWVCGKLCNFLSHTSVALSLAWMVNVLEHKLVFTKFCRGCVRYCHHNTSCYRVQDFWATKCGVAYNIQEEATWEWDGCSSIRCFSQGPSAKILSLSPTASATWWKGTDYSCSTSEEILWVNPCVMVCCLEWNKGFQSLLQW